MGIQMINTKKTTLITFAMLAIMAVVTTVMASPLFELLVGRHGTVAEAGGHA